MTPSQVDIDRLVREVVRRLTEAGTSGVASAPPERTSARVIPTSPSASLPSSSSPNAGAPSRVVESSPASSGDTWKLDEKLITVATLASRPAAARRVVVPQGAVVTPAAKDLLRHFKLELRFATNVSASSNAAYVGKLYLHATPGALTRTTLASLTPPRRDWQVETLVAAPLPQATAELSAVLGNSRHLAVLLVTQRDLALCLANRHASLRAIAGGDKQSVAAAIHEWGANLLVIDPRQASFPTVRGWIDAFVQPGPRTCPLPWKNHLES